MISFLIAIVGLVIGYLIVPMPTWNVFLIQILNIAGTGPIFGALSGALNIQSTVYYPIGVVTGIALAACAALYFKKKTPTTISV